MQSLDLVNQVGPFRNEVHLLKPKELFYLRLNSLVDVPDDINHLILKSTFLTSEVILSIPAEDFGNETLRQKYFDLGIKGFSLRFTHNVEKWLKHTGAGQFHAGDRDIIDLYRGYLNLLPSDKDLLAEFKVGSDTRVLAPTITGIYELGLKWLVLDVEGEPTLERCVQMRDIFEYLKIRSCTRLNAYFPFWKSNSSEWNIKTQNTFAGLEFVHIDISNRCTHSCVFCGLYGPEAIEDMKRRGGGELSAEIKKFMKLEIDSEKCLNIIQSLPLSVKNIQFGGVGDPLMHENAVNFIAAARNRGFSVEMLSNMEYLNDSDIEKLHKLGGKGRHNLHFIANISAGTSELYIKTRPKQTDKSYQKIIHNISSLSKLRIENGDNGAFFTLMCVVNKLNCHGLLDVAKLAKQLGAYRLWFKPMEIHGAVHEAHIPKAEQMQEYVSSLSDAIKFAEQNGIEVFQKDYCDEIIRRYKGDVAHV